MCLDKVKSKHKGTSKTVVERWKAVGDDCFIYAHQPLVRGKWLLARRDKAEELSYIAPSKYKPGFHVLLTEEAANEYCYNHCGSSIEKVLVKGLIAKGRVKEGETEVYKYIKFAARKDNA
jgi:hypothetical protein